MGSYMLLNIDNIPRLVSGFDFVSVRLKLKTSSVRFHVTPSALSVSPFNRDASLKDGVISSLGKELRTV